MIEFLKENLKISIDVDADVVFDALRNVRVDIWLGDEGISSSETQFWVN